MLYIYYIVTLLKYNIAVLAVQSNKSLPIEVEILFHHKLKSLAYFLHKQSHDLLDKYQYFCDNLNCTNSISIYVKVTFCQHISYYKSGLRDSCWIFLEKLFEFPPLYPFFLFGKNTFFFFISSLENLSYCVRTCVRVSQSTQKRMSAGGGTSWL